MEKIFNFDENLEIIGVNAELFFELNEADMKKAIGDYKAIKNDEINRRIENKLIKYISKKRNSSKMEALQKEREAISKKLRAIDEKITREKEKKRAFALFEMLAFPEKLV